MSQMDIFVSLCSRITSLFQRRRLDADLDEELRSHVDLAIEENLARGMDPQQARIEALRSFGGVAQTRETYRMHRGFPMLDQLGRDLRYGFRQLYRSPGFALTAILTLALGLGANASVFSLVNALLLRPLPVPRADQLSVLGIHRTDYNDTGPSHSFCAPMLRALEKRHEAFQTIAGFSSRHMLVRNGAGNVRVYGSLVSGQYFEALSTKPLLGRYLTPQDDRPGNPDGLSVVLSESLWRTWFNSTPDVVGRTLTIANTPFTVVGVMPQSFFGADPTERPAIYVALSAEPVLDAPGDAIKAGFRSWWIRMIARRLPEVSPQQADAALRAASLSILEDSQPDAGWLADARKGHFQFTSESGSKGTTYLRIFFTKPLLVVFALCGGVLLLACLNLASLLMARAASRERELATRLAIGASRRRLLQQLLVESLMITTLGTLAGLALSPVVSRFLATLLISRFEHMVLDTSLDPRVFLFAAALIAISTVLVGLLPALRATSGDLTGPIKQAGYARSGRERHRLLPRLLLATEVALALILVAGAGLLAASLVRLYRTGLGFEPKGVSNLDLSMDKQPQHGLELTRWYQSFGEGLSHLPGVETVSFDEITPLSGSTRTEIMQTAYNDNGPQIYTNRVAPKYFVAMRIPLLQGRDYQWTDTAASGQKIILNESAAKALFPGHNAVGQTIQEDGHNYEVIAVVGDVHYGSVRDAAPPGAYYPITQGDEKEKLSYTAVIRMHGGAAPPAAAARKLLARMAPEVPAPAFTTMSDQLDASISAERLMALLSVFFALCALLVTGIGLYGTLAYATARRTSEIGIRMALGAQRVQVVLLVFRENAWVALCGSLAGLAAAIAASRLLTSFLYGTSARDPWVLAGSALTLAAIASAASLLPAIRAARVEPMVALRSE